MGILAAMVRSDFVRGVYTSARRLPILGAYLGRLARRALPYDTRIWMRIHRGAAEGLWFYADPRFDNDFVDGVYDPWMQDLLQQHLQPGDCFYDVGAHRGFFSLMAARMVDKPGAVIAFEADPSNASCLRANAAKNRLSAVEVVEAAVWSSNGRLSFNRASEASSRLEGSVTWNGPSSPGAITVASISLDDFASQQGGGAPHLVKIDVEGAELEVLNGARRLLGEHMPKLVCEVHRPEMVETIRAFLGQLGYATEHWQPKNPRDPNHTQHYVLGSAGEMKS